MTMFFLSFFRALKFAWQNFWRNIWLSVVTIFILVLTLFSITFSSGVNLVAQQAITLVKNKIDVSIYFTEKTLEEDVHKVQDDLAALPEVKGVTYISREEALAAFKEKNAKNPVVQEVLDVLGTNPLGATLVVQAKRIEDFPTILKVLDKPEYQTMIQDRDFEDNQQTIARLSDITNRVRQVGLVVSAVFAIIAVLVMFNTIRITIYAYREEISIMKLVGATNWFVRAPFILESVLYALIASAVALLIILPLVGVSAPYINHFFGEYNFDLLQYFQAHLWSLFGVQVLVGVVLAIVSSMIAIGRHLRV